MRRVTLAGLALVGALLLAIPSAFAQSDVTAADPGITARTITIGGSFPLTGGASSYAPIPAAMKAYFSYINARRGPDGKRGVFGRQIVFKYYDDGYNPVNSVQQQRRLVEQDKVFAVVGTLGTEVNQAVQPYLNSNKVPHVLVSTGASDFGKDYKKYPWTIGWQPDYVAEGRLYGSDINKNHPNAKIAILYQNDSYGKDYVAGFKSALGTAKVQEPDRPRGGLGARQRPAAVAADPAAELGGRHADDLRHADADDPGVRGSPGAQLEAGQHLRELGVGDRHVHGSSPLAPPARATVNGSISAQYLKDPASPAWANDATVKQYLALMAKYNPSGQRHRRAQLLRLREGGHVRPRDVQGREEPDAGRPDAGAALVQRDVAVPAPGLEAEDELDRPLHHLAPAADDVQQRRLDGVRRTRRRAAARLISLRKMSIRESGCSSREDPKGAASRPTSTMAFCR